MVEIMYYQIVLKYSMANWITVSAFGLTGIVTDFMPVFVMCFMHHHNFRPQMDDKEISEGRYVQMTVMSPSALIEGSDNDDDMH